MQSINHVPCARGAGVLSVTQCADRLHQRWRAVESVQLEELPVDLWKDVQLRAMPPEEAAAVWLSPVKVQVDISAENNAANWYRAWGVGAMTRQ